MISHETYRKIQKHKEYGVSMLKTSEKLNLSYKTVYVWWNRSEEEFFEMEKNHEVLLDNYRQYLIEQIKITPQINDSTLLKRLKKDFPGFEISKSAFYRYVKNLRTQTGYEKSRRMLQMRAETEPSYEGQVDFGQYAMKTMYGNNIRVYFFCMVLAYSRMKFVWFSTEPFNAKRAVEAHRYAFRYFGGRPQMMMYDQDRCLVVSENFGEVIFVKEFEEFIKETGFSVYLCHGYDPQMKGRVEKTVDFVKRDFLDGKIYCGIDVLNAQALQWLDGDGNGQVNCYTKKPPREMFKKEFSKLQKVYEKPDVDVVVATPHTGTVRYLGNLYQLPKNRIDDNSRVRIERHGDYVLIYHALTNDMICKHKICEGEGNIAVLPEEKPELTIEQELLEEYSHDADAVKFLRQMRKQAPRYVFQQCRRLRQLQKHYTPEQFNAGFNHCLIIKNCSVSELISYLMFRYGDEAARKAVSSYAYRHYKDRAEKIREEQFNG